MTDSVAAPPDMGWGGYWVHTHTGGWVFRKPGDDPFTPLFDETWAATVGKHLDKDHSGVADAAEEELEDPSKFAREDGSVYQRVNPDEFEAGDE